MGNKNEILVVGAGPAGLVASIDLARQGFEVTVREKEDRVGGDPGWHPSAHATPLKGPETWEYIGIDCSPCFADVSDRCDIYMNEKKLNVPRVPTGLWVCERGGRESSLDYHLYQIALHEGVRFEFGRSFGNKDLTSAPENTILASGLTASMYPLLGKPFGRYAGYHAFCDFPPGEAHASIYFGGLGKEYGYTSALNGIWYVLLFSRGDLPQENLDYFRNMMEKYEGKKITDWRQFFGAAPKDSPRLFYRDRFILAGTLAGFIETNLGFGITGALISGKIAALAVTDRNRARAEFDSFTSGIAKRIAEKKKGQAGIGFQMGKIWFKI
ncbi:MAG TPA: NAD(P)-binding protein [bacterium]|nr:NAD(P)-binding protein [bacterium]